MKNIFENAYFGKVYKTRDGRKVLYLDSFYRLFNEKVVLALEGSVDNLLYVYPDGGYDPINDMYDRKENSLDIISEWQEEINEELDKLTESSSKGFWVMIWKHLKGIYNTCEKCYKLGIKAGKDK